MISWSVSMATPYRAIEKASRVCENRREDSRSLAEGSESRRANLAGEQA